MNVKKLFGLAAMAGFLFVAAPSQQASAASLASPAAASAVQSETNAGLATQVQYRRGYRGGWHGHRGWHRPHYGRHYGWGRGHRRHWR